MVKEQERLLINAVHQRVDEYYDRVQSDPYRLKYHLMPPVGFLNDPNGFVYFQGKYHLFYQWNPFETTHGAKFWGHYSSPDLVHWIEEPIALAPVEDFEKNGCYSGSAVEHNGQLYVFYTGNLKNENGRETYQCLAISIDGIHFKKEGPVIFLPEGFTPHFRDPKVWKHEDNWYMVIGAQDERKQGCVVLYSSENLYDWQYENVITGSKRNDLPEYGYMWECPDFMDLNGKEILIVSPQGIEPDGFYYQNIFQSGYFVGKLDYEKKILHHGLFTELDRGFDFYAPQTTVAHGRRLLFAWMGITDESERYHPTIEHGWVHAMTMPRELTLKGEKLYQQPVVELQMLRKEEVRYSEVTLNDEKKSFAKIDGETIELVIDMIVADNLKQFLIDIQQYAEIIYYPEKKQFTLRRKRLMGDEWEERSCLLDSLTKMQIYLDRSSIEIFINDGEEVFTSRIFPEAKNQKIEFHAEGRIKFHLSKWSL